jgi:DNA-directed RNA polymerase specialized sigma24 family protein
MRREENAMLTVVSDLSIKEIAAKGKESISAVKQWRKGARDKLKGVMETQRCDFQW